MVTVGPAGKERARAPESTDAQVADLQRRLAELGEQSAAERERLRASLEEKELLLREVHHRVKNNLQVIISLLSLQRRYTRDDGDRHALEDMLNRVSAMALVHEELNLGNGVREIDFRRYTSRLVNSLILIHAEGGISHHFILEADAVAVDADTAVTLGLLLNEAVSNAFKHAFEPGTSGDIRVVLRRDTDRSLYLSVSDNGRGFPEGFDLSESRTLGLSLMASLVQQLGGELRLGNADGARIELRLPPRAAEGLP